MLTTLRMLHIFSATVGLLSGFMAMSLRKGSSFHAAAGTVFFVSMLGAAGAGAFIAGFLHPNNANLMGSTLTLYLIATAWVAARRKSGRAGIFDLAALLWAMAIAAAGATWGLEAAGSPTGTKGGYPAGFFFVFGSIALLFAAFDVRMLVRGGAFGVKRIARHLWRMSLALLFAALSFYPGQSEFFSKELRDTNLLYVPHVLLFGSMIFWQYRVSVRRRLPQSVAIGAAHHDAMTTVVPRAGTELIRNS